MNRYNPGKRHHVKAEDFISPARAFTTHSDSDLLSETGA